MTLLMVFSAGVMTGVYLYGALRLRRTRRGSVVMPVWRAAAFLAGVGLLVVALAPPLATLSEDLLSAHMVQHLLLIVPAPALILLGRAPAGVMSGLPPIGRDVVARVLRRSHLNAGIQFLVAPLLAVGLHIGAVLTWHHPALYQSAASPVLHAVEHAAFFLTALAFWHIVIPGRRWSLGAAVLGLFAAALAGTVLGALLAFSPSPWYSSYEGAHGLSVLQDQQLAGMLMWVPPGLIYAAVAAMLFLRVVSGEDWPRGNAASAPRDERVVPTR